MYCLWSIPPWRAPRLHKAFRVAFLLTIPNYKCNSNGKYRFENLPGVANDEENMYTALIDALFNVATHNVGWMTCDGKSRPMYRLPKTKRYIMKRFSDFCKTVQHGVDVCVYISGHGIRFNGVHWIVPSDVQLRSVDQIPSQCIPVDWFRVELAMRQPRIAIFVIDSCNKDLPTLKRRDSWPKVDEKVKRGICESVDIGKYHSSGATKNTYIFYAAASGTKAIEIGRGVLTASFIKHMKGNDTSLGELFGKIRNDIQQLECPMAETYVEHRYLGWSFHESRGLFCGICPSLSVDVENCVRSTLCECTLLCCWANQNSSTYEEWLGGIVSRGYTDQSGSLHQFDEMCVPERPSITTEIVHNMTTLPFHEIAYDDEEHRYVRMTSVVNTNTRLAVSSLDDTLL